MNKNPWMQHLKDFQATHPELKYAQVMKEARKTYIPVTKMAGGSKKRDKADAEIKRIMEQGTQLLSSATEGRVNVSPADIERIRRLQLQRESGTRNIPAGLRNQPIGPNTLSQSSLSSFVSNNLDFTPPSDSDHRGGSQRYMRGGSKSNAKVNKAATGAIPSVINVLKDTAQPIADAFDPEKAKKERERLSKMDFGERLLDGLSADWVDGRRGPSRTYKSLKENKPISKILKPIPILGDIAKSIGLGQSGSGVIGIDGVNSELGTINDVARMKQELNEKSKEVVYLVQ